MLKIKPLNKDELDQAYQFLSQLEPQDGFKNHIYQMPYEQFKNNEFDKLIKESKGIDLAEGRVPQTYFFLWDHHKIVGIFKVRHYLNETLKTGDGHIGYAIGSKHRRKGYATKGLKLLLRVAKDIIQEDEIYFCAFKYNKASQKAQIKNGAKLHHTDDVDAFLRLKKSDIK